MDMLEKMADSADAIQRVLEEADGGCRLRVKVVPGSSRTALVGVLGDRLKVAVAAPPEGGRANKAVCALLADALGLPRSAVAVAAGAAQPHKTVSLRGLSRRQAAQRLADMMSRS